MVRNLQIRRWLCAALVLPLAAGPAVGAEGIIGNMAGPNCPTCNAPGSGPCPANVKYFGYYPTRWRPWPGTQPVPTPAPPAEQTPPIRVQVPPPDQEGVGKPGGTSGDTGTANPPAGSTTDPNSSSPPANPNATPPGAGVPMLNGLPLPNGAQLPNGAPGPNLPLLNGLPQPNGASTPNKLPAPNQPDPAAKGSQLLTPVQTPVAVSVRLVPSEPMQLSRDCTDPAQPAAAAAIPPTAMATEIVPRVTPVSAPVYQWPPANILRSSTMKAGFQVPVESSIPRGPRAGAAAAWTEPLPPLDPPHTRAPASMPSNSLRIDMLPIPAQASVASTVDRSSQAPRVGAARNSREFNHCDDNVSLLIVAQKPARPASIPADDWLPNQANTRLEAQTSAAVDTKPNSRTADIVAARFSLTADQPQSRFVHPASWVDRSESNAPTAAPSTGGTPSAGRPANEIVNPFRAPVAATTANSSAHSQPLDWSAANSPATLAPLYNRPATEHPIGNIRVNLPGAISSAADRTTAGGGPTGEIRFSPLRDAVVNVHPSADEGPGTSMSAIDPLQIGRAIADDQQPAMRALPIRNALSTNRFEASDYVSQERAARPTSYASTQQPLPGSSASGTRRITDTSVQTASFEQAGPSAAPNLGTIDPLEVARSLGATPAPSVRAPTQ